MKNLIERFKHTDYLENGKQLKFFGRNMEDCSREELYVVIGWILDNPFAVEQFVNLVRKEKFLDFKEFRK